MAGPKQELKEVIRYHKNELRDNAGALFDVSGDVVAGALQGTEQSEFSIDEAKQWIEQFMNRRTR